MLNPWFAAHVGRVLIEVSVPVDGNDDPELETIVNPLHLKEVEGIVCEIALLLEKVSYPQKTLPMLAPASIPDPYVCINDLIDESFDIR
jgi:hypothetical protein